MELKLKLKIKEVEVELTMEDVKKLKELLAELCETKVIKEKEYLPYYWNWRDWYYKQEPWYNPVVTCHAYTNTSTAENTYTSALSDNITYTLTK